jgi:hypothetical protein
MLDHRTRSREMPDQSEAVAVATSLDNKYLGVAPP